MDKSLQDKAIALDESGKKYVLVLDRIKYFNETYPFGTIKTEVISEPSDNRIIVKAFVTPYSNDSTRHFSAHSQASWSSNDKFSKTSALEVAETSAVGRALAMMGIGVIDTFASADEVSKAKKAETDLSQPDMTVIKSDELVEAFAKDIGSTTDVEDLKELGKAIKDSNAPAIVKDELRKLYNIKMKELKK